ncbi:bifunctional diguanylate cyclase/phosphodiesterase [Streptomyces kaniharaensis]|uniref:Bifunctional diguanylate cyclase/phosphodiesterase n=1 Tax=Streptomyces kaniharaensis TaxID=212423 RepID=A0A6N7KY10_9ACTN|nr:bifunctional diguanylate cyclase/phosphodiesterase [Streptomyces kaniharaensis]MQS15675.1 bifunctional diguanylate cyclase/phosphodiesterase [Streptomyces kaniharaensis]
MGWLRGGWRGRVGAWWAFPVAGTAVIVAFVVVSSPARFWLPSALGVATAIAVPVGVRINRPPSAAAWYVLALGTAPYAAADTIWGLYQVRGAEVPFPGLVDWLYLAAYLLYAVGLLMFGGRLTSRAHWVGLLDAGIVTLGFATLSWVFIIGPYVRSHLDPLSLAVSVAYPVADLVLLCLAARLVLTAGYSRGPSFPLLIGWLATMLAADALYYGTSATTGTAIGENVSEVGWMISYLFLGTAALRPAPARPTEQTAGREITLSRPRLAALLALALMGPAIVVLDVGGIQNEPRHIAAVVGMVAALAVLLVLRVSYLARYAQARAEEARLRARALEESLHEQAELQHRLSHQAFHDPLTGLANRLLLGDRLEHAVDRPSELRPSGLLLLDLDGFKYVNDSLGHPVGDELLIAVANRLVGGVRRRDLVARLGGDEFAVLVDELNEDNLSEYMERILGQFQTPFVVADHRQIHVTASLGARLIREPGKATDALRDADVALYLAKTEGKNRMVLFQPHMRDSSQDHARIAEALRGAADRDELMLYYQPVVALATGEVGRVKALLRWAPKGGGLVPPNEFIPVAEETGVIVPVGGWVLRQACLQARHWHDALPERRELAVIVNVSGRQLWGPDFSDVVAGALDESGLAAGSLILEISEATLTGDREIARSHIARLRGMGVRISVQDFGTRSSLACLRDIPVDAIKLDPSFVSIAGEDRDDILVRTIVHLGRSLGLDIVAEGVETAAQADRLRALGCLWGQGFHFGRPMTAQVMEWHLHARAEGQPHPSA